MPRLPNQNPGKPRKPRKPFWDNVVGAILIITINGLKLAVILTYWALERPNNPKVDAAINTIWRVRRETR